jgi:hypothetical protein
MKKTRAQKSRDTPPSKKFENFNYCFWGTDPENQNANLKHRFKFVKIISYPTCPIENRLLPVPMSQDCCEQEVT